MDSNSDKSNISFDSNLFTENPGTNPIKDDIENKTIMGKSSNVVPESWTLRLIFSERFTPSMAIEYLNSIQDKPILAHLGKKLFKFPPKEMDFFLPQLIYLYITKLDVASVCHAYIESRYKNDEHFTVLCFWLLECYTKSVSNKLHDQSSMLRELLINGNNVQTYDNNAIETLCLNHLEKNSWFSSSNYTQKIEKDENVKETNGASTNFTEKTCPERKVVDQKKFINGLIHIATRLTELHLLNSKQEKTVFLHSNLHMLNSMLPCPVWIPFDNDNTVLNLCVTESAVLNSKEKVPYIFFAEVRRENSELSRDSINKKKLDSYKVNNFKIKDFYNSSDPSVAVFAESWVEKKQRVRMSSQFNNDNWDLVPVIVKTGDDLSQEAFAQQMLLILKELWHEENVPLYLRPYKIVCVNSEAGLIEPVLDTLSLHQIKRHMANEFRKNGVTSFPTLKSYFEDAFGPSNSEAYVNAQKNFIQSTAAYSLVSYFLQLKDRHNGNILLDMEGHLIHIDFGFLLSSSPRNLGFETAPFKLTSELIEVMGGIDSDMFLYYKSLLLRGIMAARKHHRRIVSLAEIMSNDSKMQCFRAGSETVKALESRFHVSSTDEQLQQIVDSLVDGSRDNYTTRFYDSFQYYTNGIH